MNGRSSGPAAPGPNARAAAAALASLLRSPLDGYVGLAARYRGRDPDPVPAGAFRCA